MSVEFPVEWFGYPGAGKSTIVRSMHDRWNLETPKLCPTRALFWSHPLQTAKLFAHPVIASSLFHYGSPGSRQRRKLARAAVRQSISMAVLQAPAVLDEGVVHQIWKTLYSQPEWIDRAWWKPFFAFACPTVLLARTSPAQALEGMRQKRRPGALNRELLEASLSEPRWQAAEAAMEAVVAALEERGKDALISVDAEAWDVEQACEELAPRLEPAIVRT